MPEIFASGIVSSGMKEGSIAFMPDGRECYWTLHPSGFEVIVMSKIENGKWTKPDVAPFSGKYLDGFPSIHPNRSQLFFHSFRPTGNKSKFPAKLNLWYVEREDNEWGEPKLVDTPVNGYGNSACPSVTETGNLYFSKRMPSGNELIVCSRFVNGKYIEPEPLPDNVNTTSSNFHACVAPDESYLIIPRKGRDDLIGEEWNYYVSFKEQNDQWGDLRNLGYLINNTRTLITPSLSADGKYFFFEAKSPEVYFDSLNRKIDLSEFQKKEIDYPVNNGEDIYWVGTDYIELVKSLEHTNVAFSMQETMDNDGIKAATNLYWKLKKQYPDFYDFSESMLNNLGYRLLNRGKMEDALKIFKLNVEVYPESSNTYDSLGEAYMKYGNKELAIENYKKSIELNPDNSNAKEMLRHLGGNK